MTAQTKTILKTRFNTGDIPTETDFSNFIDSLQPRSATLTVAAVDSTLLSKSQADYVCDGVNDEVEIQAAIDALPAVGGKVFLYEGNFNIYSVSFYNSGHGDHHWYSLIVLPTHPGVIIEGIPGATTIKLADNQHDTVFMLLLTGANKNTRRTNPTAVIGITWDMNGTNQPEPFPGEYCPAIEANYIDDVSIHHCHFKNPKIYAVEFAMIASKCAVTECYFEGGGGVCVNSYNILVHGNIFNLMTSPPSPVSCGVGISPDTDEIYPILPNFAPNGEYTNFGAIVSNNTFMGGNFQIDVVNSFGAIITGNVFCNRDGVCVRIVSGYAHGILVGGSRNIVNGNVFYNISTGIWLYNGAQYNIVSNNSFFMGDDRQVAYGIREQSGAAVTGNNMLANNYFQTNGQSIITIAGNGTIIRDNMGWRTENFDAAVALADGGTIDHGLIYAPTWVSLVGSVAGEILTATSLDATHITVAIKKHDGTPGTAQTVYWEAKV